MVLLAQRIVNSNAFSRTVIGIILFSAILLGLETNRGFVEQNGELLKALDHFVISFFVFEILLKLMASGRQPSSYFRDHWNIIDLIIVAICLIPSGSNAFAVFRLLRVLRILRLITALPKLQIIVSALFKSVPSMGYVVVLLSIHFYMFGVLGAFLFGENDPLHFGTLGRSFLSLFQILTLEGWVDVMRIQIFGCSGYGYEAFAELCRSSKPQPLTAVVYFISFIVLGTMIILNLLIGVVVNGMAESHKEVESENQDKTQSTFSLSHQIENLSNEVRELKEILGQRSKPGQ